MEDLAVLARDSGGNGLVLARVVALHGFGSRRTGESAVFGPDGCQAGRLVGGTADEAITAMAKSVAAGEEPVARATLAVGDGPAVAAGLACGGSADVVASALDLVPPEWWEAVGSRSPAALVTDLRSGRGRVVRPGTMGTDPAIERLLRGGRTSTEVLVDELVEVWWPTPRLLVVGRADLATALERQAALLGWDATTDPGQDEEPPRRAAASLGAADALVVLSHDHDVATPALAAALEGETGFVGALGSRHTQQQRRQRLLDAGMDAASVGRLRGPVGLDLGSRTPEEQAVAIVAEILALRSGREAKPLTGGEGAING